MATSIYYIEMKTFKYGWKGDEEDYKGIASALGVKTAKPGDKGIVYGADTKPPRVRVNVDAGSGRTRAYTRFCDPDNIEDLIIDEKLTGDKYKGKTITSVRVAGSSGR